VASQLQEDGMADRQRWRPILFDCPRTGERVQGMLAEEAFGVEDARYQTVTCLACSGVHIVDPIRGSVSAATRDGAG
jgi:hypothetical protein